MWGPLFASPDTLDGMSHEDLSRALVAQDRDAHAILIDSTKTAWRSAAVPFRLASALGGRLHARASGARPARRRLVRGEEGRQARRPPAAAAALGFGGTRLVDREPRLRAVRARNIPTAMCASATRISPARLATRCRACSPSSCLGPSGPPRRSARCDNRHQLYGNRMRAANLSLAEVREDAAWQRDMPRLYRVARLAPHRAAPLALRLRLSRGNARGECALVVGVTVTRRSTMPAKSAAQQKAAGAALSAKRGKTSPSKLKGASRGMYKSMSEKQLDEFASTKRKGKPEHVRSRARRSRRRAQQRGNRQRARARRKSRRRSSRKLPIAAAPARCRLRRRRR